MQQADNQKALADADATFRTRDFSGALEKYRATATQAGNSGDASVQSEALSQVARCLSLQNKYDEGRPFLERAGALANRDMPLAWSRYLTVRGIYERDTGSKEAAVATFKDMYTYCMERGLPDRAINAAHMIAIAVPVEQQPEWGLKGIAAAEAAKQEQWLPQLWNNLGASYEDLKQYDKALDAYRKAKVYHYKYGNEFTQLAADWAVGHACRLVGRLDEAEEILVPVLERARKHAAGKTDPHDAHWPGYCLRDLGEVAALRGDKPKALKLLREARNILREDKWEDAWAKSEFEKLEARIAELEK